MLNTSHTLFCLILIRIRKMTTLGNLPRVTQLRSGRARIQIQAYLKPMYSLAIALLFFPAGKLGVPVNLSSPTLVCELETRGWVLMVRRQYLLLSTNKLRSIWSLLWSQFTQTEQALLFLSASLCVPCPLVVLACNATMTLGVTNLTYEFLFIFYHSVRFSFKFSLKLCLFNARIQKGIFKTLMGSLDSKMNLTVLVIA